jgi:hypothetical protein
MTREGVSLDGDRPGRVGEEGTGMMTTEEVDAQGREDGADPFFGLFVFVC